jgi:predicted DNA binding CopG/RHH family protein
MKLTGRKMPDFKNEDEEREFWATHSPLDFFDAKDFKKASFPNLKPSIKSISIRLPEDLLAELKILANKKDVPYQSLAKIFLAKQIVLERESLARSSRRRNVKTASRSKY